MCIGFPVHIFLWVKIMSEIRELLLKKARALPEQPGVYIMKNSAKQIIYIGKAKNLRNRVSQYFGSQYRHTVKVRKMVENVNDFDYIIVSSEFEALVLECSLIKQNMPKYNILLKDDKGYSYVRVKNDGWKDISCVFHKKDDGCVYYGPYMSKDYVNTAVKEALDIFMLPHCGKSFPQDIKRKGRPCLNYHIKLCSGACAGLIDEKEHNNNCANALRFILGEKNEIIAELRAEMESAAENLEFERAAKLRDKLKSIEKIAQKQTVVEMRYKNQDVFGVESIEEKTCLNVLSVRNGTIVNTESFVFDRIEGTIDDYVEMITNYYTLRNDYPDRICTDIDLSDNELLREFFEKYAASAVTFFTPKIGEGATLIAMAKQNAAEKLSRLLTYNNKRTAVLLELKELLGLEKIPYVIEAYDISNMNGSENVGAMVVYSDGRPDKKAYRKFEIKSFIGQDDYRSLAEVITRRINEYERFKGEDNSFGIKPDLILLDGGIGQVNAVMPVLIERKFDVPLFGMVKDSKHRTRAVTTGGNEISINDNRSVFTFISDIQEEVHRFAIGYHRQLKNKNTYISALTAISGVGEKRAKALMKKFGSLNKIKEAGIDELKNTEGISEATARLIYNYFRT